MFFFEFSAPGWLMWFVVLGVLIALNELTRRYLWAGIAFFAVLPIILTIFVWPNTATANSGTGSWFHWVKVYSALIACLGFMAIRYIPALRAKKWVYVFPPLILAINILEAVLRDFEVGGLGFTEWTVHDGVEMLSGSWNYMNGIAGILNLLTIVGWFGIYITRDSAKTMIWPGMTWFWIVAYDIWNFTYIYNCVGDHSFYAGLALLLSCTIPAFFMAKGSWIQNRAHTLALWMMFTMAVPAFVGDSIFAVQTSKSTTALFVLSLVSLIANILVLVWQIYTIARRKMNPLTDDIYDDTKEWAEIVEAEPALPEFTKPYEFQKTAELAHKTA